MCILKKQGFSCEFSKKSDFFIVFKHGILLRRRIMTGEAFRLEFRSAFICLNGVQLPQVGILGEGLSALVEHSELPGI